MRWPYAILTTIGLLVVFIALNIVTGYNTTIGLVVGTAVWASYDSTKIQLIKYKSGISYGPGVLLFAIAFLWIIGFPWYLIARGRILRGIQPLKEIPVSPEPPVVQK